MKAGCIVVFSLIECVTICLLRNNISKSIFSINRDFAKHEDRFIFLYTHMNISTNSNIRCMKHKKYVGRSIIFHKDGSTNLIPIKGSYNNRLIFL